MLHQLRVAVSHLNPKEVRESAGRPVTLALHANSEEMYRQMERFFCAPEHTTRARNSEIRDMVKRGGPAGPAVIDIHEQGMAAPGFAFNPNDPNQVVREIIEKHPDLRLALASRIFPFRAPVVEGVMWDVSKENAVFSLATALPAIVPFISLPWAVGEFASDAAFLTMNQVRMAFLLAAASNRPIGYREQKAEVASIVAGAFGFRAIARELVGKIPMGGGLIPKAAVAFAGTFVVGASLERYYRLGYGYTEEERKRAYEDAFERGKSIAQSMLNAYRSRQQRA